MSPLITVNPNFPSTRNPIMKKVKKEENNAIAKSQRKSPNMIRTTVFPHRFDNTADSAQLKSKILSNSTENLSRTLSEYFEFLSESSNSYSQKNDSEEIDEP